MSATLTPDVAEVLNRASYTLGWEEHACANKVLKHVNPLLCGDTPGFVFTSDGGKGLTDLLDRFRMSVLDGIRAAPALHRGKILPICDCWMKLVEQINRGRFS